MFAFLDFQILIQQAKTQSLYPISFASLRWIGGWLLFFFWDQNWITHLERDGRWGVETERLLKQMYISMLQKEWNIISVTFRWRKVNIC